MDENRGAQRHRTLKKGTIALNDHRSTIECLIRNLSESGAQLKIASIIGIPDTFDLVDGDKKIRHCRVAWKRETEIGVEFV